jgi:tRNA-dihydrouridine synthase
MHDNGHMRTETMLSDTDPGHPFPRPADAVTPPDLDLCLAPLRGVTGESFRTVFCRHFGGVSRALAPFIPTVRGARIKPSLLAELRPERNRMLPLIPQVIGKDPGELTSMLGAMREMGYACADLNAGCPWPMVARKGRGAGLLADAGVLRRMLDAGCTAMPGGFSIKVRLGLRTPDLLAQRMELLNEYPLREVAIHPRTAQQMYEGRVDLAAFAACARLCRHPVVYNGDICTAADGETLKTLFPGIRRWMIGRGLLADPFLAERLRGACGGCDPARVRAFLDELLAVACAESPGEKPVLGRMKELWGYLAASFCRDGMLVKRIRLCHRLDEYRRTVDQLFDRPPVWREPADGLAGLPCASGLGHVKE